MGRGLGSKLLIQQRILLPEVVDLKLSLLLLLSLKLRLTAVGIIAKTWMLKARAHHRIPLPRWKHGRTGAGNGSKVQQTRYIQSNVQRFVIRLKGPPLSSLDPVDG